LFAMGRYSWVLGHGWAVIGEERMRDIMVGDTVTCAACGQRVTAMVQTHSNLTALVGLPLVRCVDGSEFHPWPEDGCPIHGWSHS
jgi:hypothetical protein